MLKQMKQEKKSLWTFTGLAKQSDARFLNHHMMMFWGKGINKI